MPFSYYIVLSGSIFVNNFINPSQKGEKTLECIYDKKYDN